MSDNKKRIDLSKYTNNILTNPKSSFNTLEPISVPEIESKPDQPVPSVAPKGHDQTAKGIRQMMAHFDYQEWADQMGSRGLDNQQSTTTLKQQRHSQLSEKDIKQLKKRRKQVKQKFKHEWLYKETQNQFTKSTNPKDM